jgi:mannose-6-phosphate isomerase-like protein (cupin superfamily)
VPINFFDTADDHVWEPLHVDQDDPNAYWHDGGFLRTAPVDAAATFEGAMWAATEVEPAFQWRGRRIRSGFTVPKHHQNMRQLRIVVGGDVEVEYGGEAPRAETVRPGGFFVVDEGVPFRLTAGADGVSYLECWTGPLSLVETHWYDDPSWIRS